MRTRIHSTPARRARDETGWNTPAVPHCTPLRVNSPHVDKGNRGRRQGHLLVCLVGFSALKARVKPNDTRRRETSTDTSSVLVRKEQGQPTPGYWTKSSPESSRAHKLHLLGRIVCPPFAGAGPLGTACAPTASSWCCGTPGRSPPSHKAV